MSWYVRRGEHEIGPLGEDALRALVGTGQVSADTPLWRAGLSGWTAARLLPGVLGPRSALQLAPALATPWRRYWARSFDLLVSSFLAAVLLGAIRPSLLAHVRAMTGQGWIIVLLLLPLAFTMDALIHWTLGNTPGKALAGIKVLREGERAVGAAAYLGRNFGVYVFGLGLGLPLISLLTLLHGYRRAVAAETSIWDRLSGSRAYAHSGAPGRTWVTAAAYVLAITTLVALGLHAQHNRSRYAAARVPTPVLEQELTQAANGVNASSPHMVDAITRLDGADAGPGALFTYDYTLTNIRVSSLSATALQTLRWRLSAHVRRAACAGTALKPMFRAGAAVRFHYRDRDGRELALVSVSSADCGD